MKNNPEDYKKFKDFLDSNKERYGLVSYEFIDDIALVLYLKKGFQQYHLEISTHPLKPEGVRGIRTEIVDE